MLTDATVRRSSGTGGVDNFFSSHFDLAQRVARKCKEEKIPDANAASWSRGVDLEDIPVGVPSDGAELDERDDSLLSGKP